MKHLLACAACILSFAMVAEDTNQATQAEAEKGVVIFYRTRAMKGAAIRLNITGGDDGKVGLLSNGSKIVKELPPGSYTFNVTSPSIAGQDSVIVNLEAGQTRYVKGQALLGWPAARCRLTLMDEAKGKSEAEKIK